MSDTPKAVAEEEILDDPLAEFGDAWERGNDLVAILRRLPGELVLKSGLAARRKSALSRWDALETPTLDGEVPEGAQDAMNKWIHDAKRVVAGIIQIGNEPEDDEAEGVFFEVVDRLSEAEWIVDKWCWPWDPKALAQANAPKKWNREKFIKAGVIGAIGIMAFIAMVEEEE